MAFLEKHSSRGVICWGCGIKNCGGVDTSLLKKTLCNNCTEDLVDLLSNVFIPQCDERNRLMWEVSKLRTEEEDNDT